VIAPILFALVAGCGAEPPPPAAAPERRPPPAKVAPSTPRDAGRAAAPADWVIGDWATLRARLHGLYVANVEPRTTAGGVSEWCARPTRRALGEGPAPREVCTAVETVVGRPQPWHPPAVGAGPAWVATELVGSLEEIAALAGCGEAGCAEPPGDLLAEIFRCGQIDTVWEAMPSEHRACFEDRGCVLLEATCFETAVAERFSARYRAVVDRHGGRCLDPRAGACAAAAHRAVCGEGRCEAVPSP
jgi:hypothetical protein